MYFFRKRGKEYNILVIYYTINKSKPVLLMLTNILLNGYIYYTASAEPIHI